MVLIFSGTARKNSDLHRKPGQNGVEAVRTASRISTASIVPPQLLSAESPDRPRPEEGIGSRPEGIDAASNVISFVPVGSVAGRSPRT
jgi:hypothetical protein